MVSQIDNPMGFVCYLVDKYYQYKDKDERDDLCQTGYIGYLKALENYDETKAPGNILSQTYAAWYIRQEINMYLKSCNKYNTHAKDREGQYLYNQIDKETTNQVSLNEQIIEDDAANSDLEAYYYKDRLYRALNSLKPIERVVIIELYLKNKDITMSELGETLGVSRQRIHQIKDTAVKKLKEKLVC